MTYHTDDPIRHTSSKESLRDQARPAGFPGGVEAWALGDEGTALLFDRGGRTRHSIAHKETLQEDPKGLVEP